MPLFRVLVLFACGWAICCIALPTLAKHTVTFDDAYAIKGVGAVKVSPDAKLVAMEADGGIIVFPLAKDGKPQKRLRGSHPSWSPDGSLLAFFSIRRDGRQLHVWNRRSDSVKQVTEIPGGILANLWFGPSCEGYTISWSPDSRSVVFATRLTG